jgi:hypothetical protein
METGQHRVGDGWCPIAYHGMYCGTSATGKLTQHPQHHPGWPGNRFDDAAFRDSATGATVNDTLAVPDEKLAAASGGHRPRRPRSGASLEGH